MAWRVLFSSFYPPPCFQQHWRLTSDRHCTGGTVPVSHPNLDIIPSNILRTNKWKLNRKINWQKKQTKKQCYRQKLFKSNLSNGRKGKGIAKVEDVKSKLKLLKGLKSFSSQGQRVRKEKDSSQILSLEKGSSLKLLDIGDLEVKFSNSGMSKDSRRRRCWKFMWQGDTPAFTVPPENSPQTFLKLEILQKLETLEPKYTRQEEKFWKPSFGNLYCKICFLYLSPQTFGIQLRKTCWDKKIMGQK